MKFVGELFVNILFKVINNEEVEDYLMFVDIIIC